MKRIRLLQPLRPFKANYKFRVKDINGGFLAESEGEAQVLARDEKEARELLVKKINEGVKIDIHMKLKVVPESFMVKDQIIPI